MDPKASRHFDPLRILKVTFSVMMIQQEHPFSTLRSVEDIKSRFQWSGVDCSKADSTMVHLSVHLCYDEENYATQGSRVTP